MYWREDADACEAPLLTASVFGVMNGSAGSLKLYR